MHQPRERTQPEYTEDQIKLMRSQDLRYINFKRTAELKVSGLTLCTMEPILTNSKLCYSQECSPFSYTYLGIGTSVPFVIGCYEFFTLLSYFTQNGLDGKFSQHSAHGLWVSSGHCPGVDSSKPFLT